MDFTAVLHPKGRLVYLHNKLQLSPLSQFALKKNGSCREEDHAIARSGLSGPKARLNNKKKTTIFPVVGVDSTKGLKEIKKGKVICPC